MNYLLFLCIFGIAKSLGKIQEATINTNKNVAFLDSFAYGTNNVNLLHFKFFFPSSPHGYKLAMFDDSVDQWPYVRRNEESLTCTEKLSKITDPNFKINLTEKVDRCKVTWKSKEKWLFCKGYKDFSLNKIPHRYFFHLANCHGGKAGIWNVTYNLHMTNGLKHLEREFSYDQRYLMMTDLAFLLSYLGILLVATINHVMLCRKRILHVTYRLFFLSLILQLTSLLLHCTALGRFASYGKGLPWLNNAADILSGLSSVIFVALLLLVSKGYTITRSRISLQGSIKLTILAVLYAVSYLIFFIYRNILVDPRDILSLDSIKVAAGPLVCRITGLIWTLYGVFFTVKNHRDKLAFYLPFSCFFSLWFMTEPVTLILATTSVFHQMDSGIISNALQLLTAFFGHTYFLFLTMPITLNKSFPFHLPVSKVGILPATDGVGSLYKPSEEHYDIFSSNGSPKSARGTVQLSSTLDPINLPPVFLHNDSFDEQRRKTIVTRVASSRLAMPNPPVGYMNEPKLPANKPADGFSIFSVMGEACKADKVSPAFSESHCQSPVKSDTEQREYLPYKLTPIIAYHGDPDDIDEVDDDDDDDVNMVSLGLDVFNKPLPGDEWKKVERFPPTKLPKLTIPGKKKPASSAFKTPRKKNAKDTSGGPAKKEAWSSPIMKERKRLKRLAKLRKFAEMKLPSINSSGSTEVTRINLTIEP